MSRDCNIYHVGPRQEKQVILSKLVGSERADMFSVLGFHNYIRQWISTLIKHLTLYTCFMYSIKEALLSFQKNGSFSSRGYLQQDSSRVISKHWAQM